MDAEAEGEQEGGAGRQHMLSPTAAPTLAPLLPKPVPRPPAAGSPGPPATGSPGSSPWAGSAVSALVPPTTGRDHGSGNGAGPSTAASTGRLGAQLHAQASRSGGAAHGPRSAAARASMSASWGGGVGGAAAAGGAGGAGTPTARFSTPVPPAVAWGGAPRAPPAGPAPPSVAWGAAGAAAAAGAGGGIGGGGLQRSPRASGGTAWQPLVPLASLDEAVYNGGGGGGNDGMSALAQRAASASAQGATTGITSALRSWAPRPGSPTGVSPSGGSATSGGGGAPASPRSSRARLADAAKAAPALRGGGSADEASPALPAQRPTPPASPSGPRAVTFGGATVIPTHGLSRMGAAGGTPVRTQSAAAAMLDSLPSLQTSTSVAAERVASAASISAIGLRSPSRTGSHGGHALDLLRGIGSHGGGRLDLSHELGSPHSGSASGWRAPGSDEDLCTTLGTTREPLNAGTGWKVASTSLGAEAAIKAGAALRDPAAGAAWLPSEEVESAEGACTEGPQARRGCCGTAAWFAPSGSGGGVRERDHKEGDEDEETDGQAGETNGQKEAEEEEARRKGRRRRCCGLCVTPCCLWLLLLLLLSAATIAAVVPAVLLSGGGTSSGGEPPPPPGEEYEIQGANLLHPGMQKLAFSTTVRGVDSSFAQSNPAVFEAMVRDALAAMFGVDPEQVMLLVGLVVRDDGSVVVTGAFVAGAGAGAASLDELARNVQAMAADPGVSISAGAGGDPFADIVLQVMHPSAAADASCNFSQHMSFPPPSPRLATCPGGDLLNLDTTITSYSCSVNSSTSGYRKVQFDAEVDVLSPMVSGCAGTGARSALGGYIESASVTLSQGQRVQFKYQGLAGADWFDLIIALYSDATSMAGTLVDSYALRGKTMSTEDTGEFLIPATGDYYLATYVGSYDFTGGGYLGGTVNIVPKFQQDQTAGTRPTKKVKLQK
ncbi:hypothetical protein FOA52_012510 [Chlamydomonas sp. UWO 241]|nr:hypothetical protein FOA52_012510 [Chlamydomonas sp. UWO 241]